MMFMNKRIRMMLASIFAAASILVNTIVAAAAPYSNIEDIRSKALRSYLSANNVIAVVNTKAPAINLDTKKLAEDGVLTTYAEETVTEEVPFNTIKRLNMALDAGETVTVREGEEGKKVVKYSLKYENGNEISREILESYITENPVDKIVEYGIENSDIPKAIASSATDTSKLNYKYIIECEATAYDMSAEENGGYAGQTATGVPLDKGVIAVDPRVIPLGSRVYVEALDGSWSYGYAVAADTGGAIKGRRVDLCYRTRYECIQFGRRACRVYVLN